MGGMETAGVLGNLVLGQRCEAGVCVLSVRGELDLSSGAQLEECLIDLAGLGSVRIVLDAAGLTFCDASGIRVLLRGRARLRRQEGWLCLLDAPARVRLVLEIVGLVEVLPVFGSVGDAVAGMCLPAV